MAKTKAAETARAAAATTDPLTEIGRLAVEAHQATVAYANGRAGAVSYRGPDGQRELAARKGEAERRLREAIEALAAE